MSKLNKKVEVAETVMIEDDWIEIEEEVDDIFFAEEKEDPRTKLMKQYFRNTIPTKLEHAQFKLWCLRRMEANMALFGKGAQVTCMSLMGCAKWCEIPGIIRRQISKEFKIAVAQKKIKGIIFLVGPDNKPVKQNGAQLYMIMWDPAKLPPSRL